MKKQPKKRLTRQEREKFKDIRVRDGELYVFKYSAKTKPIRGHRISGPTFQASLSKPEIKIPKKNKKKTSQVAGYVGATTRIVQRLTTNEVHSLENFQSRNLPQKKFVLVKKNNTRVSQDLWETCGRVVEGKDVV